MVASRPVLALLAVIGSLPACGPAGGGEAPSGSGPGDDPVFRPTPAARLAVEVADGEGGSTRAALVCAAGADRATGYLRREDAPGLCRRLGGLKGFLISRPPRGRVCTLVDGGPATARISGRIDGRRVARRLARNDGCEISDWDRVDVLLPEVE